MNVALVGFDREGRASYEFFAAQGAQITICDQKTDISIPDGVATQLGDTYLDNLDRFDVIVRTPGLSAEQILQKNPTVKSKITSGTNLFFEHCPTKNIIGITGTKGKGTTSTLTFKMLQATGKTVHLGGNIGVPALSLLSKVGPDDWVVLELSSFQLSDIRHSPHIAACLMIADDHLNWHGTFEAYTAAKKQLFMHQTADDIAIYYAENEQSKAVASVGEGALIPYGKTPGAYVASGMICIDETDICATDDVRLVGAHNLQNVCAAITATWQVTQDVSAIQSAITSFEGLPHRLEKVTTANDITYFNDSFASNPDATLAAISAIEGTKIMLIGGYDRMLPVDTLILTLKNASSSGSLRQAIFYGASAGRLEEAAKKHGFTNYTMALSSNFSEVMQTAAAAAQPNDSIILSPGFASFDMFKNFEDRGNQFKHIVKEMTS